MGKMISEISFASNSPLIEYLQDKQYNQATIEKKALQLWDESIHL